MNDRVYVSKEEWEKLDRLAQLELIALSNMTGEEVCNAFSEEAHRKEYDELAYGE